MNDSERALLAFVLRLANAFVVCTFFQPDEYFQSLEPAHRLVFGWGYLTWEWHHALRSIAHSLLYAIPYTMARMLPYGERTLVLMGPKLVGAAIAASIDLATARLARACFGREAAHVAFLLSLSSGWMFFASTRALSNTLEALLTAAGLSFWPWTVSQDVRRTQKALLCAAMGCALRPTNGLIWMYLSLHHLWRQRVTLAFLLDAVWIGSSVLTINGILDTWYYGRPVFPPAKFFLFNFVDSSASFYGISGGAYYLLQGIPFLLLAALPHTIYASWILRSHPLVQAVVFVTAAYSCIPHKEIRFLFPLLAPLLAITANLLSRQGGRRVRWILFSIFLINALPAIFLSRVHQRGVVDVVDYIAQQEFTSVGFLMPCHSTPWHATIHRQDIDMWFLTCEPPLSVAREERETYVDEADRFYLDPATFLAHFAKVHPAPEALVTFDATRGVVEDFLRKEGRDYVVCARFFNTYFHDDSRRRGDVLVFCQR